jgi:hypothetical protein
MLKGPQTTNDTHTVSYGMGATRVTLSLPAAARIVIFAAKRPIANWVLQFDN